MTAGVVIFAWFAMPRPRQAVVMAIMLSTFTPLTRFVLSSVAEVFFMSLILIYAGLFLAYKREHKEGYIHVLLYLTIFLTIMRAYYCLLILLLWINISAKILNGGAFRTVLMQDGVTAGSSALGEQTKGAVFNLFALLSVMAFSFFVRAGTDYDRMVPFGQEALRQEIRELGEILERIMDWINHCSQDYVMEHFDNIRSRYIAVVPGGIVERKLEESGAAFFWLEMIRFPYGIEAGCNETNAKTPFIIFKIKHL